MKKRIFEIIYFVFITSLILTVNQSCTNSENLKEKAKINIESVVLDTLSNPDSYEFISISEPESFGKENVVHRIEMAKNTVKSAESELERAKEMQKLDIQQFGESGKTIRQNSIDYEIKRLKEAKEEMNFYNSMLDIEREIYLYAAVYNYYAKDSDGIASKFTFIVDYDYDMNVIDCQKLGI